MMSLAAAQPRSTLLTTLRAGPVAPASVAALLLTAFGLKWQALALGTSDAAATGWPRGLQMLIVAGELLLAGWLLSGRAAPAARRAALFLFILFVLINAAQATAGQPSCGCFGAWSIPPLAMLAVDAAAVVVLALWRPASRLAVSWDAAPRRPWAVGAGVGAAALILGLALDWAAAGYRANRLLARADDGRQTALAVLEPEKWLGQPLPVLDYLDVPADLARGDWLLVLHRHDCSKCQEVVPAYERQALDEPASPSAPRVALIEVPPFASVVPARRHAHGAAGRLRDTRQWFVTTPVVLALKDGTVIAQRYP